MSKKTRKGIKKNIVDLPSDRLETNVGKNRFTKYTEPSENITQRHKLQQKTINMAPHGAHLFLKPYKI